MGIKPTMLCGELWGLSIERSTCVSAAGQYSYRFVFENMFFNFYYLYQVW